MAHSYDSDECWDNLIYKRNIRAFLADLKKQAHPIYAMMAAAPKTCVWIDKDEGEDGLGEEVFSFKEFSAQRRRLDGERDNSG